MEFLRYGNSMSEDVEDASIVQLKSKGTILDKNATSRPGAPMVTFLNFPIRSHVWNLEKVCFNKATGDFAVVDERGQVYAMSLVDNIYRIARLASTPVSAIEFVHSRTTQMIVAYSQGAVVVIDTLTRDIVGNLQTQSTLGQSIVKCHPTKPFAVMVSSSCLVSFWDLRTYKTTRS